MDSDTEIFLVAALLEEEEMSENEKRQRRFWVHPINKSRPIEGEFNTLFYRLVADEIKFFNYFRMSYQKYSALLNLIKSDMMQNSKFRRSVSPEERLAVCLRFLVTGDTFKTISYSYRLGVSTVRGIVHSTCKAICDNLMPIVIPEPTEELWKKIELEFRNRWNFPNCIGAIDGKHVIIQAPKNTGSLYFNYKKTFSIVLLGLVDADYKFIAIDVGSYGKNSDGGIFRRSAIGEALDTNSLHVPDPKPLPGTTEPVPYVIVGDEAFPLKPYLMRPYPGAKLQGIDRDKRKIFNYRLSRARRLSENVFGILTQKFRIYQRRIQLNPENVKQVVVATCCLHNFIRDDKTIARYDAEDCANDQDPQNTVQLQHVGGNAGTRALEIRESFANYFISPTGSVPWQEHAINAGRQNDI